MTDINKVYPSIVTDYAPGKTTTIVHRAELIRQSPFKRWDMCGDARVRPEHRNINQDYGSMYWALPSFDPKLTEAITRTAQVWTQRIGRALRNRDGFHQGTGDGKLYQVYRKGKKWVTAHYSRDSHFLKTSKSKRRALAIAKGEAWLMS
jgi:hypothetical protein